uniref:Plant heme peroxidase family profile domain-containing protein n=1 Tax=Zea mays TaxID=4577 RepID=C0PMW9_MAIZE|nr:unknown [Zea mays]
MSAPLVDAEYMAEIERARRDLRALVASKNCAPIMLRLAWHDAGTYDAKTNTGGPNGSIRFPQEYSHSSNAGIKIAIDLLEPVKQKHPKITYADLYQVVVVQLFTQSIRTVPWFIVVRFIDQLAGVVAVEVTGGPTVDFVPGRKVS